MLIARVARCPARSSVLTASKPTNPPQHASLYTKSSLPPIRGYSYRHHHGHSSSSHSWSSSHSSHHIRYSLLLPFFASSPLLMQQQQQPELKPSLASIKANMEHPDSSEFLISNKAEKEKPASVIRKILNFLQRFLLEPIGTGFRFLHLAVLFLPVIVTSPVLVLEYVDGTRDKRRGYKKREKERALTRWWYWLLVNQMALAGPTFIKLAQWAGSRTDLFPAELCARFGKLHSNGDPHSFRYTKHTIEKAFGLPFHQIFTEFAEKPMGIGAIAQVYKAVLNPDLLPKEYLDPKHVNETTPTARVMKTIAATADSKRPPAVPSAAVAIKVLHPGVEKMIARDLKIMMFFARALNSLPGMEWLSFPEEVQVFGEMMMSQIDLRIEANNLLKFEENFKQRPTVSFPRALKSYTSKQVLVEEYEDAVPLEAFLNQVGSAFDHRLADLGLDAFLHMLLIDDFTHSDLHPGNIMVKFFKPTTRSTVKSLFPSLFGDPPHESANRTSDVEIVHNLRKLSKDRDAFHAELERLDAEGYQAELIFIDAGLVTKLEGQNRKNFLDLFSAITRFDGYEAGRLMVERCRAPELVLDEEEFALRIQHLVLSVKSQTFSLGNIRIGDVLSQVLNNVRRHHVKMEADFVNTVISILLLEGIGRQLDPNLDLFKSALPILRQLGKQVGTGQVIEGVRAGGAEGLLSMLKVWVYIEARQMASLATKDVDQLVKYDYLMPNV